MEVFNRQQQNEPGTRGRFARFAYGVFYYLAMTLCLISVFHSSLLVSSLPLAEDEVATVTRAVDLLDAKGFRKEAFLLRHLTVYRSTDNWLNALTPKENAFAATNFPLNVVTLYPDFFTRATDDTERAAVLLHEAQHIQGANEQEAYEYVWRNRARLGWTLLSHGTTESYVSIESLTREAAPGLFTCSDKLWNDCTEISKPANLARNK
jgi:hypothetical protein